MSPGPKEESHHPGPESSSCESPKYRWVCHCLMYDGQCTPILYIRSPSARAGAMLTSEDSFSTHSGE
jgi:hypothetical protein